jgi:serine/threonine protein kinase/tetratricopeptide (TPR) repeat protein
VLKYDRSLIFEVWALLTPDEEKEVPGPNGEAANLDEESRADFVAADAPTRSTLESGKPRPAKSRGFGADGTTLAAAKSGSGFVAPQFSPGDVLARRFKIVSFIAAGGMGQVYEAEDLELKESVAVKCMSSGVLRAPRSLHRFRREVNLARKVTHPNVCRIFDLFHHVPNSSQPEVQVAFLSMELLHGESLASRIKREGKIPPAKAMPIIMQLAEGLDAAHRAGIVHRDFKPANVMLVRSANSEGDRAVITDFGVALHTNPLLAHDTDQSSVFNVAGTPAYMAPEQIEGGRTTPATDIYAFGLVIFEMLTGTRPFSGDTPAAAAAKKLTADTISPKPLMPDLAPEWDAAVVRCLRRSPTARFSSASEVVKAIQSNAMPSKESPAHGSRPAPSLVIKVATGVVIACLLGAVAYKLRSMSDKNRGEVVQAARRPSVAVMGFTNLSGAQDRNWISPSLTEMLGTELGSGERLRLIPTEQVTHAKSDLSLAAEDSFGPDTLHRLRNYLGTDYVVEGSYLDTGDEVRVNFRLQNASNGETVATFSEQGTERDLPKLVSTAGESLRSKLGIAEPTPDELSETRASQSTNLEATKLYAEGLQKLHSYDAFGAKELFERAIVADPKFALAHAALAEAWTSLGYGNKAEEQAQKAFELSKELGLPLETRLKIEAEYRGSMNDHKTQSELYKTLFDNYQDNLEYGLSLARSQYLSGEIQEAGATLDALQRLPSPSGDDLRIDFVRSSVELQGGDYQKAQGLAERVVLRAQQRGAKRLAGQGLALQCTLQSKLGNTDAATDVCNRAQQAFAEIGDYAGEASVWGQIGFDAANRGDLKTGRTANEKQIALLKKLEYDRGLGWAMTVAGELASDQGDFKVAVADYNEALRLYERTGYQAGVVSAYGNLGYDYGVEGDLSRAIQSNRHAVEMARATKVSTDLDIWLVDLADELRASGDIAGSKQALDDGFKVNQETGDKRASSFLHSSRAELLLAQWQLEEARREASLALEVCENMKDDDGIRQAKLLLSRLDIAGGKPELATSTARAMLATADSRHMDDFQIGTRSVLLESLVASSVPTSHQEIAKLLRVTPVTENLGLRLTANLQIGRVYTALGQTAQASEVLGRVAAEAQSHNFEIVRLEAEVARAQLRLITGDSRARSDLQELAKAASAKQLYSIANRAQALSTR